MGFFRRSRREHDRDGDPSLHDFENDPDFQRYIAYAVLFDEAREDLHRLVRSGQLEGQVADKWRGQAVLAMVLVANLMHDPEMDLILDRVEGDLRNSEVIPAFSSVRREVIEGIDAVGLPDSESAADALRMLYGVPDDAWDSKARHDYRRILSASRVAQGARLIGSAPNEATRHLAEELMRDVVMKSYESGYCGEPECPHCEESSDAQ